MSDSHDIFASAIRLLLRPVLRLCVRHSIKLQELIEMVKVVFIQVAKEELEKANDLPSVSKISAATGVHRKDVTRLERTGGAFQRPDNQISKIMTQWQCDPRFTTKAGKPRVLNCEGKQSDFAELVGAVNGKDLSSYSILFEMERMGIVERRGSNVKLRGRDFIHEEDIEAGLRVLAADADDLVAAVEQNLFTKPVQKNLHLRTEFDRIPNDKLEHAKQWIIEEGSLFHSRVRKYLSKLDLDTSGASDHSQGSIPPCGRISVGAFAFSENFDESQQIVEQP